VSNACEPSTLAAEPDCPEMANPDSMTQNALPNSVSSALRAARNVGQADDHADHQDGGTNRNSTRSGRRNHPARTCAQVNHGRSVGLDRQRTRQPFLVRTTRTIHQAAGPWIGYAMARCAAIMTAFPPRPAAAATKTAPFRDPALTAPEADCYCASLPSASRREKRAGRCVFFSSRRHAGSGASGLMGRIGP